ncbi:PH domain-containing protein [Candidatus Woesearchaeota archaeon]|nr:PH domain-containing protein [Candidatus Woesearchaeota archaeon]
MAILLTIFSLIPTIYKFVILYNIKYHFFKTHVLSEFKLLKIDRKSIPYSQVVNITTNISLWDRLCKAGDIILHTADDEAPNLTLYYIDDPVKVEQFIYGMIKKTKSSKF